MIFKQFKRIICILVGFIYLYSIVTHKDKYTYKKDMQKAEPGMGFNLQSFYELLRFGYAVLYGTS